MIFPLRRCEKDGLVGTDVSSWQEVDELESFLCAILCAACD